MFKLKYNYFKKVLAQDLLIFYIKIFAKYPKVHFILFFLIIRKINSTISPKYSSKYLFLSSYPRYIYIYSLVNFSSKHYILTFQLSKVNSYCLLLYYCFMISLFLSIENFDDICCCDCRLTLK